MYYRQLGQRNLPILTRQRKIDVIKNTKVNYLNLCDVMVEMENDTLAIYLFGNPKNFPIYPFPYLVMTGLRKYSSQKATFNQK